MRTRNIITVDVVKVLFAMFLLASISQGRAAETPAVEQAFQSIPVSITNTVSAKNSIKIPSKGGHLQGVQRLAEGSYLLSGSSSQIAYLAQINGTTVDGFRELMAKPFRHAGGFQVNGKWFAIGIEDNAARNQSVIHIYHLGDDRVVPDSPSAIIERKGDYQRVTAGAVGVSEARPRLWIVVGDWDSRHLDFYSGESDGTNIELSFSIEAADLDRSLWIDNKWFGYQNLNLFSQDGLLYLIGTTSMSKTTGVADLFLVDIAMPGLVKVGAKRLSAKRHNQLRWGGGVFRDNVGNFTIMATEKNIRGITSIVEYQGSGAEVEFGDQSAAIR